MSFLIGLTGPAHSGKDTVAKMVQNRVFANSRLSLQPRIMAFAEPMKTFVKELFDFSHDQIYGDKKEEPDRRYPRGFLDKLDGTFPEIYLTPRFALQTLGTEWGRNCYKNIWIEYAMRKARSSRKAGIPVLITDCRFLNEAAAIRAEGGMIWRVVRPGTGKVGIHGHASEEELYAIQEDAVILNASTKEELEARVIDAVDRLLEGKR